MLQDPVDILAETGSRALYIDLHSFLKLGASQRKQVSLWLKQLPFPIVGVVAPSSSSHALIGGLILRFIATAMGLVGGLVGAVLGAMLLIWLWQMLKTRR